jgi:hypothetical protein
VAVPLLREVSCLNSQFWEMGIRWRGILKAEGKLTAIWKVKKLEMVWRNWVLYEGEKRVRHGV